MSDDPQIRLVEVPPDPAVAPGLDDDDLMIAARAGHQQAFETLVKRHQAFVFALATRYLGDRTAGRDVTQDVFLSLWAERGRYVARGKFRSYLVSVTLHRCHAVARRRKTRERHLQHASPRGERCPDGDEAHQPLQHVVEREKSRAVRERLSHLPGKPRQVLILRFTHDLTLEEIATTTGFPVGTVKSHIFRGLKQLRHLLHEEPLP